MSVYEQLQATLIASPKKWLVTGVAGFIGSNLLESLLKLNQHVVGLDNFSTGSQANLAEVKSSVTPGQWSRFQFHDGDICDAESCERACVGVDIILHQAALGSVPRSIEDPLSTNRSNVLGFLNMLVAARDAKVNRFVYASSSSVYGDNPDLPKREEKIGNPLSPYAASKLINEIYATAFVNAYGVKSIGLRYFNVFGPRQDPHGAYAAVIPQWISALLERQPVYINGDGETSRDFCFVKNVVQANLLAACAEDAVAVNQVFNIAVGKRTTLNELFSELKIGLCRYDGSLADAKPAYRKFRTGDVRHSLADIGKARQFLKYEPTHDSGQGLKNAMDWYWRHLRQL